MLTPLDPGINSNKNFDFEESRAMRERNAQFGKYTPLRQQKNRENENQPNYVPQSREITDPRNRENFPHLNGTVESEPIKSQIIENQNKDVRMINLTDIRPNKSKNNHDPEEDKRVELSQQTYNTSEESGFDKTQEPKYIEKFPRSTLEQASNTSDLEGKYQPSSSSRSIDLSMNTRPRREKKKRGLENKPKFEDEKPKIFGKDKDKARREAKFSRSEDEEVEAQKNLEQKLERQRIRAEKRAARKTSITPLLLPQYITIANLAVAMRIRYEELATKMKELGYEDTHSNVILNAENSTLIAMEYSFEPMIERDDSEDLKAREPHPNPSELPRRPPIVTIMGHVDHGKTTLLDFLRKSSVAASEFGGITQHIGAFSVPMPGGKIITFLDTPGHAAFLSMRQRGANVTDIVVLVVASDDSVKPQTIEAINHAKAADVPMIVAINKIDKPESDPEKVKLDLARYGVEIEDFGGDTQVVCVSGKTGKGMTELEETISALSEILDLQAEATGPVEGWVLEASIKTQGKVATILIRRGTLRSGDIVVAGDTWAKVRILRNEFGTELIEAGPGTPVEVDGWREQPLAGDEVLQAENEAIAKRAVVYRLEKKQLDRLASDIEVINAVRDETRNLRKLVKAARDEAIEEKNAGKGWKFVSPQRQEKTDGPKKVPFVIKADVSGSLEAVLDQVNMLCSKEVEPNVIRSGVGPVSEFDVSHASAASGYIINFSSAIEPHIARLAAESGVKIIDSKVIYALIEAVKAELSKLLTPIVTKTVVGEAEISMIFSINVKNRKPEIVAGCKVVNGSIKKTGKVRVLRSDDIIFDGELSSLKVLKRSVSDVEKGNECGIVFKDWTEFKPGDHIQQYDEIHQKRYL
ncbi:BgTH12-01566 [Blumeria graminis f. sp. triticale]|uniref:Translation initiation factor IF-2, mitochondrial n=1 Tax=Blumeria graminis f. sp. triticale TaxID=1689686 RepID=A0A9W4DGF5_BLUGR|nr:BgTH12-01566 [Blumeria graminis f. sp. triticale]